MMLLQRACAAENQVKNKSSNGPLRVQMKDRSILMSVEYSATQTVLEKLYQKDCEFRVSEIPFDVSA